MKTRYTLFATGLFVIALLAAVSVSAFAQEFTFRFNPPDATEFTVTVKSTRVQDMDGSGKQVSIGITKSYTMMHKTANGFSVSTTPLYLKASKDGKRADRDPAFALFKNVTATYDLDADGKLLEIRGYDKLADRLNGEFARELTAEQRKGLIALLPSLVQSVVARAKAEWNETIAGLAGKKVKVGDSWTGVSRANAPTGGEISFNTTVKIAQQVDHNGHNCLRIDFSYTTDEAAVKRFIADWTRQQRMAALGSAEKMDVLDVRVAGSGQRIVDPSTMLTYRESMDRTITMVIETPRERKTVTLQETKDHLYHYYD